MAVVIERERPAVRRHELLDQEEVAVGILGQPEQRRRNLAGGVINGRDEGEAWPAPLQPVVWAGVDLHQHARLGVARPSPPMGRGGGLPRAVQPALQQDAPDTRPGQGNALALGQQFAQVLMIAVPIGRLGQREHVPPHAGRDRVGRAALAVAVPERPPARGSVGRQQAPDLADGERQHLRRRPGAQLPLCQLREYRDPLLLLGVHTPLSPLSNGQRGDRIAEHQG